MYNSTRHQQKQIQVINKIEKHVINKKLNFSTVSAVEDYDNDQRLCLTSVHFPNKNLIQKIKETIIRPLQAISPQHYYYRNASLHITIKNIRIINNPPNFTQKDITKIKKVFSKVIPLHKSFNVYFYRLLLFPMSLALIGTTDPELDKIILHLDRELKKVGLADDKKYLNKNYFFSNITLARFTSPLTEAFKKKILEISNSIKFTPYKVNSVTLMTANASVSICNKIKTLQLEDKQ